MPIYIDQLNREVSVGHNPSRIISLVPSITELLSSLKLREQVVGVTKFCEHPSHWRKEKTIVGGTKIIKQEVIADCKPDLIIANKEENNREDIEQLSRSFPVWVSDVKNFSEGIDLIEKLGIITDKIKTSNQLIQKIDAAKKILDNKLVAKPKYKVAYLIWEKPMMIAGGDTYINEMIEIAGGINVFKDRDRYPAISDYELKTANPDYIFLSSEPFPFKKKHLKAYQDICPTAVILLVDGTYFSWYGSRMLPAMEYFHKFRD